MAKQTTTIRRRTREMGKKAEYDATQFTESAMQFMREYARERPEVVALWTFGIGFILGWKLKPW